MRAAFLKIAIKYAWYLMEKEVPYIWAGNDEHGLDCSGLVVAIFRKIGIIGLKDDLSSTMMYEKYLKYKTESPNAGCLVFYGKSLDAISHVGFMITPWHILEAGGGNRHTKTIEAALERNAKVRLNPYNYRKPLAIVDPFKSLPAD